MDQNGFPGTGHLGTVDQADAGFPGTGLLATGKECLRQGRVLTGLQDTGRRGNGFPVTGQDHHLRENIGCPGIVDQADAGFQGIGGRFSIKITLEGDSKNGNKKDSYQKNDDR